MKGSMKSIREEVEEIITKCVKHCRGDMDEQDYRNRKPVEVMNIPQATDKICGLIEKEKSKQYRHMGQTWEEYAKGLEIDNARLKEQHIQDLDHMATLVQENTRLREALKEVSEYPSTRVDGAIFEEMADIAKQALEEGI